MDIPGLLSRLLSPELGSAAVVVGFMAVLLYLAWGQLDRQVDATDDVDRLRNERLQLRWDVAVWRQRAIDAGYDGPHDTGWPGFGGADEAP